MTQQTEGPAPAVSDSTPATDAGARKLIFGWVFLAAGAFWMIYAFGRGLDGLVDRDAQNIGLINLPLLHALAAGLTIVSGLTLMVLAHLDRLIAATLGRSRRSAAPVP